MDRQRHRPEETQALLEVPDVGTRKRVPLQCLRLQAETVGTGQEPQPHGKTGENLVPEPEDEK